jgi:hypothetical protein
MNIIVSTLLKLLAVVGGTAGAALFVPSPDSGPAEPGPAKIAGVRHAVAESGPDIGEVGRSPVPLIRPLMAPWLDLSGMDPTADLRVISSPRLLTERSARAAIERDGYRAASGVTCNEGRCVGRALRGQTEIGIVVEADGRVREN